LKGVEVKHAIYRDLNGLHVVSHAAIIHLNRACYNAPLVTYGIVLILKTWIFFEQIVCSGQ
jgi:hypothetical protein